MENNKTVEYINIFFISNRGTICTPVKPVITSKNAAQLNAIVTGLIEGIAEADKDEEV